MADESGSSSGLTSSMFNSGQHADVLQATANTPEAKAKLVEELKYRGNAAFKCKRFPEAEVLYSRAIEHDSGIAALHGNRSMTRAAMGRFKEALADAKAAVNADPQWVKGYYRQAMAEIGLNQFVDAENSLKKLMELDAANKDAQRELAKLPKRKEEWEKKEAERAAKKAKADEEAKKHEASLAGTKIVSPASKIVSPASSTPAAASSGATKESKSGTSEFRGYKTLADGTKTSFFHRELSEQDKALLAQNNGPRKVDAAAEEAIKKLTEQGVSAWNQAGTFEEKDMSEWARGRLKALIVGLSVAVSLKDGDGDDVTEDVKITELSDLEGDASVAFTRGKRRHIFDFVFGAKWKIEGGAHDGTTGTLLFPDVSGDVVTDDMDDIEHEYRGPPVGKLSAANQAAIKKAVTDSSGKGLYGAILAALKTFASEFRALN